MFQRPRSGARHAAGRRDVVPVLSTGEDGDHATFVQRMSNIERATARTFGLRSCERENDRYARDWPGLSSMSVVPLYRRELSAIDRDMWTTVRRR